MDETEKDDLCPDNNSNRLYDRLCIVLIVFITLVSIINWKSLYPNPVDSYYHMAVIRAFSDSGGLVLHDYWEFAPAGRPHLYAPTTHIIGFVLSKTGLGMSIIGQIMSWLPYPLSFVVMWLWVRNSIGARGAFFAIALLAGPADWFFSQTAHWANAFVLIMAPLAFLSFEKQKYFIATLCSIIACYSHGSGLLVPATILLYGIHRPSLLKKAIITSAISVAAFSPWLMHVYANRNLVTTARPAFFQLESFRLFVVIMPLAVAGIFLAYKRRGNALILPCFLLSFLVMFPMGYAHRFWQFNSFMPYAALAGYAITGFVGWLEKRFKSREYGFVSAVAVVLIGVTLNPVISFGGHRIPMQAHHREIQPQRNNRYGLPKDIAQGTPENNQGRAMIAKMPQKEGGFRFEQTAITQMLNGSGVRQIGGSSMDSPEMTAMINLIEEYAEKDDVIAANVGPMNSCLIPAMTGIRITDGMLREVQTEEYNPRFEGANIVVMQDRDLMGTQGIPGGHAVMRPMREPMGMNELSLPHGFELVAEKDGMKLFKNNSSEKQKLMKPKPVLTFPLILLIIFGMSGLIVIDILKERISKKVFIAVSIICIITCIASMIPLTVSAISELSDQPERPAKLNRQMPLPGEMPKMFDEIPEDIPPRIIMKHRKLMQYAEEEFQKGNLPDYFLPPELGIEIRRLLIEKNFLRAEKLIDEALEKRKDKAANRD